MFPSSYFAKAYHTGTFWPPISGAIVTIIKKAGSMLASQLVRRKMHRGRR